MTRLMFVLAAAAAALPATAATAAPGEYLVEIVARDGDAPPTTPRLTVAGGATATYMVANDSYSLRITTVAETADRVALRSEISTWTPDGLRNDGGVATMRADGEPARVAFERVDPATGERRAVSVEVSVRPLRD